MSEDRRHNREAGDNRPLAELISAYLDDRESLTSDELAQVERLLEEDPPARQMHAEMDVIRLGLRDLEPIQAQRSFHLDAEMVGAPEPVVMQETQAWYVRRIETVRWVTAAAAVLFVFVLGADLVLNGVLSGPADSNETNQAEQAEIMSRQAGDNGVTAGDTGAGAAAVEDESADDSGGGIEASRAATPTVAAETTGSAAEATEGQEEPAALAPAPGDEEASDGSDQTAPTPETQAASVATGEPAADSGTQAFNLNADDAGTEDESADRRPWRIAEFSLVVLLGLLITAMVVLSRLGRNSARAASD